MVIENKIKNKLCFDEILIYKANDTSSEHNLDVVVFFNKSTEVELRMDDVKKISRDFSELRLSSEHIRVSTFTLSVEDEKSIYTENGKFSRARAIKLLSENKDRLTIVNE